MLVEIVTLFPRYFDSILTQSILSRAIASGTVAVRVHDLREWTRDKHHQADDYIFGGGAGMLLKPEPINALMETLVDGVKPRPLVIYPTPAGEPLKQAALDELATHQHLIYLCGHYKGVDQRAVERWVDRQYSLGDYVVTGGETAAAVMLDATVRLLPGVLGDADSADTDSFRGERLDCPHYTRPEEVAGIRAPGVLLGGNHRNIEIWRRVVSDFQTELRRPDLIKTQKG